jgi:hypothetical protein
MLKDLLSITKRLLKSTTRRIPLAIKRVLPRQSETLSLSSGPVIIRTCSE